MGRERARPRGFPDHFPAVATDHAAARPGPRLLASVSSCSAVNRDRETHGVDPVGLHRRAIAEAWGDAPTRRLRWPLFALAARRVQ